MRPVSQQLVVLVATILVVGVFALNANAQLVDCERVPYNGRIIVVCTSTGSDDPNSPDPEDETPQPAEPSTQAGEPDGTDDSSGAESDEPSEQASDGDDADEDDNTVVGDADRDLNESERPDREDRGDRSGGADAGLGDGEADDGGDVFELDDPNPDIADEQAGNESDGSDDDVSTAVTDNDGQDSAGPGSLILATDPEPDNLPVITGIAALTAAGAAFFLAAHRKKRDEAATSGGGRRTPG